MKRPLLTVLALGASLLTAGYLLGQNNKAGTPAPAAAAKQQKLVRVATLSTPEANREFTAAVQFLQAQRQAAVQIKAAMEQEKDAKKKQELKTQLDAVLAKLNENNETMAKAYGFSLTRNYTMEIEKAHVYMLVSEEEAAKIAQAQAEEAKKTKK